MNQKLNFNFCKYDHGKNKDDSKCWNCERNFCPSVGNILYGKIFKLPIIKQIYGIFSDVSWSIQNKKFEREYINEFENEYMKMIWGIVSSDDLTSGNIANMHTMNDLELLYDKETEDYFLSIETIYMFPAEDGDKRYMEYLLDKFTNWMDEQGYSTQVKFNLYEVFTDGINIRTHFKSIEECYSCFKLLVKGYCA